MDPVSLLAHPATPGPAVTAFTVAVTRTATTLRFAYVLEGDLAALALPPLALPAFADDLWRHTCLEAFIGRADALRQGTAPPDSPETQTDKGPGTTTEG